MSTEIIVAYTATSISVLGRLVFMSLLYSKKSTNIYSLLFCIMNIASSSLWIQYSQLVSDTHPFLCEAVRIYYCLLFQLHIFHKTGIITKKKT